MRIVILPQLSVNEDVATIFWVVENRDFVKKGQIIASAETSKASVDLEAEDDGYLYHLIQDSKAAKFGDAIGLIHELKDLSDSELFSLVSVSEKKSFAETKKWTKKAEILARSKKINIEDIPSRSEIIKETDVLAYLDERGKRVGWPSQNGIFNQDVDDFVDNIFPISRRKRIMLLGNGLAAIHALDIMTRIPHLRPVGILDDDTRKLGRKIMGVPIVDKIEAAKRLWDEGVYDAALCLMPNQRELRQKIFDELKAHGVRFANVIDPSTIIHSNVQVGEGNLIQAFCRIGACSIIGDNNILSAWVNIEHHNRLGNHCTFGPCVSTSGEVWIGDRVKFGTGIFIEPLLKIGDNSIIASGTIIITNIPENSLVKTKINYKITPLVDDLKK